ncbi:competence protein CoiA family protein [Shewanella colwelliana]|uniref:competence protein CoiA family protein n=1 Tax=Shewanella colwelliana TaxID=23 RepID=UPI00048A6373|nr:competence protein CoiA family protein [Shewanella colwelliana]
MAIKTAWALKDNKLININQLDRDTERGSKCGCLCISCNSQLVARMGDHKAYHFAHGSDYNCSLESIQHQLAKAIIATCISESITTSSNNPINTNLNHSVVLKTVDLEKALADGELIADCFVNREHESFAIEIFYTNKKSSAHIERYHDLGISALEIDVSEMGLQLNRDELKRFVLDDAPRKWLRKTLLEQEIEYSTADGLDWITADDTVCALKELHENDRLYDFVGAIGTCGQSSFRRRERINVQSVEGVIELNEHYVLARGFVNRSVSVAIMFPLGDYEPQSLTSPTLVVDLDIWGSHHRANWHGIEKWKKKLQYQADLEAEKKEQRRLKRLTAKDNELKIEHICKMYKQSSSLTDFYRALAEQTGLELSDLPFMSSEKIMTNWNCPRAVWRAIVLLVFVRQGKELECDMIGYDMFMNDAFGCDYRYAENRSKEVYFWLDKHFETLGAKKKRLVYQFHKSKLPKNFDAMMVDLITS